MITLIEVLRAFEGRRTMKISSSGEVAYRLRLSEHHLSDAEGAYRRGDLGEPSPHPALCRERGEGGYSILQGSELEP